MTTDEPGRSDGLDRAGEPGRSDGAPAAPDPALGIDLEPATLADLHQRLRKVEGQVRGIQQMLDAGRDCREVVAQISAANKALEQVGFNLVAAGLTWCLQDPDRSAAAGYEIADVRRMFLKLA